MPRSSNRGGRNNNPREGTRAMTASAGVAPLLQLRGIETFYGKIQALKGVDIDVNSGEIVTLIGANGAGKSTTMMTIFGAPRARQGRITFDGKDKSQANIRWKVPVPGGGNASLGRRSGGGGTTGSASGHGRAKSQPTT